MCGSNAQYLHFMPQTLEKQEKCDASIEKLTLGLANMLPFVGQVDKAAKSPQLQRTVANMMDLIEDASRFVKDYRLDGGLGMHPRTSHEARPD